MRTITKTITLSVDGTSHTFRLMKLDAFAGAVLLKLLSRRMSSLPGLAAGSTAAGSASNSSVPEKASASDNEALIFSIFTSLSDGDLRSLMISCLSHVEVLLEAGYQPVMQRGEWSWSELEHDASTALKLTLETALWTLQGFFDGGGWSGATTPPAV